MRAWILLLIEKNIQKIIGGTHQLHSGAFIILLLRRGLTINMCEAEGFRWQRLEHPVERMHVQLVCSDIALVYNKCGWNYLLAF